MTGRRFLISSSLIALAVVVAIVVKRSVDRLAVPPWGHSPDETFSQVVEVAAGALVGQQFVAPMPGLYRIDLVLDPATAQGRPRPVLFHLKASRDAAADLETLAFSSADIERGKPCSFQFEPLRDSKGKSYYFYLESSGSAPGDAVAVRYSAEATLEGAGAVLNGQAAAGGLQFETFYSLRTRDKLDLLLARMAAGRPYLLGTKGFYVALAVVYLLALLLYLWQVARSVLAGGKT